jgi:hypothetical protein
MAKGMTGWDIDGSGSHLRSDGVMRRGPSQRYQPFSIMGAKRREGDLSVDGKIVGMLYGIPYRMTGGGEIRECGHAEARDSCTHHMETAGLPKRKT